MLSKMLFGADVPTWALFFELILAGLVVILAGGRFTRLADTLADRLNLTSGWIGLILLATVTSLPELITGGTATAIGNVDLALGNIFGSNMFNIFVIPMLKVVSIAKGDALLLGTPGQDGTQNLIAGLLAILLTAIAVGGLAYKSKYKMLGHFGFDSILILAAYAGGMALLLMDA